MSQKSLLTVDVGFSPSPPLYLSPSLYPGGEGGPLLPPELLDEGGPGERPSLMLKEQVVLRLRMPSPVHQLGLLVKAEVSCLPCGSNSTFFCPPSDNSIAMVHSLSQVWEASTSLHHSCPDFSSGVPVSASLRPPEKKPGFLSHQASSPQVQGEGAKGQGGDIP